MAKKRWRIPLARAKGRQKYALVDENDFHRLHALNWRLSHDGYAVCFTADGPVNLHKAVYGDCPADMIVDHRNRNKLDCRRQNLRLVSRSQSQWNKGPYKTNTSGFKGVSYDRHRKAWAVFISAHGKRWFLGRFDTAEAAAKAYDMAAQFFHGEYAYQNFSR